jgi:hypothetical protein
LIINSEEDKHPELVLNLIMKSDNAFDTVSKVIPFTKIRLNLIMQSLLGVATQGKIELYFTNPKKLDESGANKYTIQSSQFHTVGQPILVEVGG